ncbi:hypothetical protein ACM66B_000984 [Microbotryomycetes sp. NB124-2]
MSSSWLARLASPGGRQARTTEAAAALRAKQPLDPLVAFEQAWFSAQRVLEPERSRSDLSSQTREQLTAQLDRMLSLLESESASPTDPIGPCLEFVLKDQALGTLVTLVLDQNSSTLRAVLVQWFSKAIVALPETFLVHRSIHKPLIKLLNKCIESDVGEFPEEEAAVVLIMVVIAERIRTYPQLLAIFLKAKSATANSSNARTNLTRSPPTTPSRTEFQRVGSDASTASTSDRESVASPSKSSFLGYRSRREHDFLLFAYLLRFVHREGAVGDDARAGLLSLIDIAMGSSKPSGHAMLRSDSTTTVRPPVYPSSAIREAALAFAEYLLESDFAEVLGAGIAALFGLLPSKLAIKPPSGSTPAKNSAERHPTRGAQGMVLGGLGALGEDQDPETAEAERQEEENALLASGVGLAGTEEFRESLDAWLKLVEFTQEVLTRLDDPLDGAQALERSVDDEERRQHVATRALSDSILSLLRTLFLQAVVYPSILESSDQDGSAVAVLSYLDALLSVVADGTRLEAIIMKFLTEDGGGSHEDGTKQDDVAESQSIVNVFLSPASNRVRRRKSSAMLIIERATRQDRTSDYFTDVSRFTLKDLLATNLGSTSPPTVIAATKLMRTLLQRHDRWANVALDVLVDESATSFPITLRQEVSTDDSDREEDPDVFVYQPQRPRQGILDATFKSFAPMSPVSSIHTHHDALEVMISLLAEIDSINRHLTLDSIVSATSAFSSYLVDAEAAIALDSGFRRGISFTTSRRDAPSKTSKPRAQRKRSSLFGQTVSLLTQELVQSETGVRHRLRPETAIVGALLDLLSRFFAHSPDVNLSLTATIASMALSPYRSLDDWLLPTVQDRSPPATWASPRRQKQSDKSTSSDDGDDRSDDDLPTHLQILGISSDDREELSSPMKTALVESDSVLAILSALATSIQRYRATVPQFDKRLAERRQGLFFADNLTDALELDTSAASLPLPSPALHSGQSHPATPLPLPSTPQRSMGFASFITGRPKHSRGASSSSLFPTPQRQVAQPPTMRRSHSGDGSATTQPARDDSLASASHTQSPFQAHYRQTGAITVQPIVVATPRMSSKRATLQDDASKEASPSRTPTRHVSRSSVGGFSGSSTAADTCALSNDRSTSTVTLSTILDNVIVLEEFVNELVAIVQVRRSLGIDATRVL